MEDGSLKPVDECNEVRVFGPPGTGKTTWLVRQIARALRSVGPDKVAIAAFTRPAAVEIRERCNENINGILQVRKENVGTLHALCLRQLGTPQIAEVLVNDPEVGFNKLHPAYAISGARRGSVDSVELEAGMNSTPGDEFYSQVQVLRARMVPRSSWPTSALSFDAAWTEWKQEHDAMDFTDLIEQCIERNTPPPAEGGILFLDEAQDFSALELSLVRKWGKRMQKIILAGDDDQCHPEGTLVLTTAGYRKIENLNPDKMRLPAPDMERNRMQVGDRSVPFEIHREKYKGAMLSVLAGGTYVRCTPDHIWFARWSLDIIRKKPLAVFLVRHDRRWYLAERKLVDERRLGRNPQSQILFSPIVDDELRLLRGHIDCWLLEVGVRPCRAKEIWKEMTAREARAVMSSDDDPFIRLASIANRPTMEISEDFALAALSDRALLPWVPFISMRIKREEDRPEPIKTLRKKLKAPENSTGAYMIPPAKRFGSTYKDKTSRSYSIMEVRAGAIIPGIMEIPAIDGVVAHGDACSWVPVDDVVIEDEEYDGFVYSLKTPTKSYVVTRRNLVTHNCLYSFKGADPDSFLTPPVPDEMKRVLPQSYRVPRKIQEVSEKIISQVTFREPKEYRPKEGLIGEVVYDAMSTYKNPGPVVRRVEEYLARGKTCMMLTPCGYQLNPILAELRSRGLTYKNDYAMTRGDWNPLRASGTTMAQRLLAFLSPFREVWGGDAHPWNKEDYNRWLPAIRTKDCIRRGARDSVKDGLFGNVPCYCDVIEESAYQELQSAPTVDGWIRWFESHLLASKVKAAQFPLHIARTRGVRALMEEPRLTVGTIHSVKGGEADVVVVFPDISASASQLASLSRKGADPIYRQFYVGVTRTKEVLILCSPETKNHFVWPRILQEEETDAPF